MGSRQAKHDFHTGIPYIMDELETQAKSSKFQVMLGNTPTLTPTEILSNA